MTLRTAPCFATRKRKEKIVRASIPARRLLALLTPCS
jgi:hypothetical protein